MWRLIPAKRSLLRDASKRQIVNEHFVPVSEKTIEHYLLAENTIGVHHLLRYEWAIRVLRDYEGLERILDIACGSGFGSAMVGRAFPNVEVIGMDHDPEAIEYALKHFNAQNVCYKSGDAQCLEELLEGIKFNCIICFETLEHLDHRELVLEAFVKLLKQDGWLLFSTPCEGDGPNKLQTEWEHHKIEYSAASLYDLLSRYFRVIKRPEDGSLPHVAIFHELRGSKTRYPLFMNPLLCTGPIAVRNPFISSQDSDSARHAVD